MSIKVKVFLFHPKIFMNLHFDMEQVVNEIVYYQGIKNLWLEIKSRDHPLEEELREKEQVIVVKVRMNFYLNSPVLLTCDARHS